MATRRETGWTLAFNRHEVAGAFGDIGTDLPLILAMVAINGLDAASAFVMFGVFQVLTALRYGLPMPVQPLKAMAAIMISLGPAGTPGLLFGGGLVAGATMLLLGLTGAVDRIHAVIPAGVVRGIQLGLGLTLMLVAFDFMLRDGVLGVLEPLWLEAALASAVGVVGVLLLGRQKRLPPALLLVAAGVVLALLRGLDTGAIAAGAGLSLPQLYVPTTDDLLRGGLLLALPQVPLSLANAIVATAYLVKDYFPDRREITPRRLSVTYGLMNLTAPFLSGVPLCHGSGGLAGHHRFGARTGGSVLFYGVLFLTLGLVFGDVIFEVVRVFPFPILGVLLFFEGFALVKLVGKVKDDHLDLVVALLVGVVAVGVPFGFAVGLLGGTAAYHLLRRGRISL